MLLDKRKYYEILFQTLYVSYFTSLDKEVISFVMEKLKVTRKNVLSAYEYVSKLLEKKEEISQLIDQSVEDYALNRIPLVERTILLLAFFQILFDEDFPDKVAMAEAIRLARKFSTKEAGAFINGVLDDLYNKKQKLIKENNSPSDLIDLLATTSL